MLDLLVPCLVRKDTETILPLSFCSLTKIERFLQIPNEPSLMAVDKVLLTKIINFAIYFEFSNFNDAKLKNYQAISLSHNKQKRHVLYGPTRIVHLVCLYFGENLC